MELLASAHTDRLFSRPMVQSAPSIGAGWSCIYFFFIMALSNSTQSMVVETSIYSDVNVKKKLWEEVCKAVIPSWNELSAEGKTQQSQEVQKRWANLRTFRREQLLFLLPCIENRQTESNLQEDSQEIDEDDDEAGPSTSTPIC
ncbi:hypothetical protein WA026_011682 [Henosepilachna vigintioctopunctata]|uniref:MADF domain-containing protein n=1 Tax=Henosepilachna vigintioctopunctata TaxID=420089 RepID=A0AAW1UD16_9CUCU